MAAYDKLKERITKSVVKKLRERKKRKNNRNDRGIPQRLKEDGDENLDTLEEEEEIEERRRRDFPPANVGAMPATLKVNEEDEEAPDTLEEEEDETLDEWYQKELYQKLTNRWTQ